MKTKAQVARSSKVRDIVDKAKRSHSNILLKFPQELEGMVFSDKLMTKFMGETSAKLRQIFDLIRDETGVYLFDEFDASRRTLP